MIFNLLCIIANDAISVALVSSRGPETFDDLGKEGTDRRYPPMPGLYILDIVVKEADVPLLGRRWPDVSVLSRKEHCHHVS